MEPNLILAQSRFKEFFAYRINLKDWNLFAKSFGDPGFRKIANTYKNILGEVNLNLKNDESFVFQLKGRKWAFEDQMIIEDGDPDYKVLLDFIQEFFMSNTLDKKYNCLIKDNRQGISSVRNSRM